MVQADIKHIAEPSSIPGAVDAKYRAEPSSIPGAAGRAFQHAWSCRPFLQRPVDTEY